MNAWTSDFIFVCWVVFYIYWIISWFNTKRTIERTNGIFIRYILFFVLLIWVIDRPLSGGHISYYFWHTNLSIGIIADVLMLVGLLFAIWARYNIGRNWSGNITFKEDHELITSGPYAIVRHPIYTGILAMGLATAIYDGRAIIFALYAVLVVGLIIKYTQEEKMMTKHFPKQYKDYKKRVKTIIPYIY